MGQNLSLRYAVIVADDMLKQTTVLFVEEDSIVRTVTAKFLQRRCGQVFEAENGRDGLELYKEHIPDIVITDLEMPVMGGLEMIDRIFEYNHNQVIIITTAYDDLRHKNDKVCIHLIKPIVNEKLLKALVNCMNVKNNTFKE